MPETNAFDQVVGDVVPDWTPRPWPTPVRLEGRYVVLEPLAVVHAPALHAALCGPDDRSLWTYRPTEPPADVPAMEALIQQHLDAPGTETFALVPTGSTAQGIVSFMRIEPAYGQVEIAGVLYSRALQRTTAATEAVHLTMRYAFDELGYRRFEWKCDSLNEPSRRAAVRLGLTYEGRFRHHMVTKGRNRDTDWYSVTDTEWPAVRAAHEAWLDPANFDAGGRQRTTMTAEQGPSRDRLEVLVDGMRFRVAYDESQPGAYHYERLGGVAGGPAVGYGFTSRGSDRSRRSVARHVEHIRAFAAQVDPVSGYIEDEPE